MLTVFVCLRRHRSWIRNVICVLQEHIFLVLSPPCQCAHLIVPLTWIWNQSMHYLLRWLCRATSLFVFSINIIWMHTSSMHINSKELYRAWLVKTWLAQVTNRSFLHIIIIYLVYYKIHIFTKQIHTRREKISFSVLNLLVLNEYFKILDQHFKFFV